MILARMMKKDSDALQCDLAETYGIYDYKELSVRKIALFSAGLRENSRIRMEMSNEQYSFRDFILAAISDRLSILVWQNTKDGQEGKNPPEMLVDSMSGKKERKNNIRAFSSGEKFEEERKRILERRKQNG